MDTTDHELNQFLADPESTDITTLRTLADRYPYFPLPAMMLLKEHTSALTDTETESLRFHLAVISGDKKALFECMSERSENFASLYPPAPAAGSQTTESAIDTFLANYGTADHSETQLLERLIFNPTPDYSEILMKEEKVQTSPTDPLDACIDAFVRDHAPAAEIAVQHETVRQPEPGPENPTPPKSAATAHTPSDDSLLSESLAKIFIKQGRYERAYEIISNLSLNYPKKSIYFADQLRFLQKLIKIQQAQKESD